MSRAIGVGVIGMGWMGEVHSRSYRQVVERFGVIFQLFIQRLRRIAAFKYRLSEAAKNSHCRSDRCAPNAEPAKRLWQILRKRSDSALPARHLNREVLDLERRVLEGKTAVAAEPCGALLHRSERRRGPAAPLVESAIERR